MAIQKSFNEEKMVIATPVGKFFWYLTYILLFPIFIGIHFRNQIIRFETKINEADSGIDVQLTKRQEMLTKLIDATKQTMHWEQETLTQLTKLRSMKPDQLNAKEKMQLNEKLDVLQRSINVQLEAYPNLKSVDAVMSLQSGIREVEDNLAAARRIYNGNVSVYNQYIQAYPTNVIAAHGNKMTKIFFEATEIQKADVKVNLNN